MNEIPQEWVELGKKAHTMRLLPTPKASGEFPTADDVFEMHVRMILAAVIPLVQAAEREACAEVVDSYVAKMCDMSGAVPSVVEVACSTIAHVIRARNPA